MLAHFPQHIIINIKEDNDFKKKKVDLREEIMFDVSCGGKLPITLE